MDLPKKIALQGKGIVTLNRQSYVAAGGQGTVCRVGGTAYKIYHDPKHMIPVPKIKELSVLSKLTNVLGPQDIIVDPKDNKPIGFTMAYKDKTEFLCRLFNMNFRSDNGITPKMITELVKCLQNTLIDIHKEKILVVDFNEMNFLTGLDYVSTYFIDVDSYQTPSYKAAALMETVRDRLSPPGQFNEFTDWFSFAVVAFQLYMGYHPYRKGKHPTYKPKDWSLRMDNNISIFHPDVVLSDNWKNFSVIPKPHFEWFKKVFKDKERSIPPLPEGALTVSVLQPVILSSTDKFEIRLQHSYTEKILGLYFFNGIRYVLTKKRLYSGNSETKVLTKKRMSLGRVLDDDPVLVAFDNYKLIFNEGDVGELSAEDAMQYNGAIYSTYNGTLTETTFIKGVSKPLMLNKHVCNVFASSTKLYPGVAVQDILGTCWLAIPYAHGSCTNIHVKELDSQRIIDAKFDNGICILISEKDGSYNRIVLCFNERATDYTVRIDKDIIYSGINFTTLKSGVCINMPNDDTIEVFKDNSKIKIVKNPPFKMDARLYNDSTSVYFLDKKHIYTVRLK